MKRLLLIILVIAVTIVGGALAVLIARLNQPYKGFAGPEQFVEVPTGSGVAAIGTRLAEAGVVRDPVSFRYAVWLIGGSKTLKAGEYRFDRAMTPEEVARKLARGDVYLRQITFREGLTIRDLGYLAHFIGDGSQPMHVSVHINGWGNYPNPQGFSTASGLHARFEGAFVRSWIMEQDISQKLTPYRDCRCTIQKRTTDYLAATQREVIALFQMEKSGAFNTNDEAGKAFVSKRLAAAASELRDMIVDAWRRSAEVSVGHPPIPVRDIESGRTNALNALQGDN